MCDTTYHGNPFHWGSQKLKEFWEASPVVTAGLVEDRGALRMMIPELNCVSCGERVDPALIKGRIAKLDDRMQARIAGGCASCNVIFPVYLEGFIEGKRHIMGVYSMESGWRRFEVLTSSEMGWLRRMKAWLTARRGL
ncbi:MAG: hypothetical protein RJQ08_01605 [Salinisphaeraceae bacterium]|uniref:hypothetical protein n=1 Tax=Marinobacter salarius TaxID=1420917 RepID=UPI0032ED21D6